MKVIAQLVLILELTCLSTTYELSPSTVNDLIRNYVPGFVAATNNSIEDLSNLLRNLTRKNSSGSTNSDDCIADGKLRPLCGQKCLPLQTLLEILSPKSTLEETFSTLCPVLFFQSHHCGIDRLIASEAKLEALISPKAMNLNQPQFDSVQSEKLNTKTKPEPFKVWFYGMISVTLISACSLTGLAIVPLLTRQIFNAMMNIFQGLAVGSLCGSALFHLLPQAFDLEQDDHLWKSLVVFCGIYFFYLSERIMKIIADRKKEVKKKVNLANIGTEEAGGLVDVHHGHSHGPPKDGTIASVAWLIIFGDGMHNFIDGLSLGAAFSNSILSGISISVAVVCEEFPHELGDFAVLLGAGMSPRQAVLYNFLSALTCFLGLAVGILVGDLAQGAPAIFAFAGGMFLYISLVGMMGEINESLEKVVGCSAQIKTLLLQNLGIISGVIAMFVMAMYADVIDFEGFSLSPSDTTLLSDALRNVQGSGKSIIGAGL